MKNPGQNPWVQVDQHLKSWEYGWGLKVHRYPALNNLNPHIWTHLHPYPSLTLFFKAAVWLLLIWLEFNF